MLDLLGREIQNDDFLIIASKASVSHVMKLAKVEKIRPNGNVVASSIENDWRGFKYNRPSKICSGEHAVFVLKRHEIPEDVLAGFIRPFERVEGRDFFNQELVIGKDYLVAKHINNKSTLSLGTLQEIREDSLIFHDREGKRFSTTKAQRVVGI